MSFEKKNHKIAQQGDLDGLCGVYCVVNYFTRRFGWKSNRDRHHRQETFKIALSAIEDCGALKPKHLVGGFRHTPLRKAFDAIECEYSADARAVNLKAFVRQRNIQSVFQLLEVLGSGEAAMIRLRGPDHWVLAYRSADQAYWIDDSSYHDRRVRLDPEMVTTRRIELKQGLVFLNA